MGVSYPKIMNGTVMHARLIPARNAFKYGIYYIALPLSNMAACNIVQECFGWVSFYNKDHGPCDGSPLLPWARDILQKYGISAADGEVVLVCMPRILGYVFNPVSFWFCYDKSKNLRAVICEVRNTFGECHSYLCAREDHQPISDKDRLIAQKIFHVSPFLDREGHYEFTFGISDKKFGVWIDYFDAAENKILLTSLTGNFSPLNTSNLRQAFWRHPLVTFRAIFLIHWQAVKIIFKGIRYFPKPPQKQVRLTATRNITKI